MKNTDEPDIIEFLSQYASISNELATVILENSSIKQIKKDTLVLKYEQIANECFFILKGCMKKYYLKDGEEKISGFYTEGQAITPVSYVKRTPSKYYISTIENTIVLVGTPDSEKHLYKIHPKLESLTRTIEEKLMVNKIEEFDDWMNHNPEERYLLLVKNRPDLIQRVPQYQIANYIGIRPESLSRIRKRLGK